MNDFLLIGGDARMEHLETELAERGYRVATYGLHADAQTPLGLADALLGARNIIGPVPLTRDGKTITSRAALGDMTLETLLESLNEHHVFLAGVIPAAFSKTLAGRNITALDYLSDEPMAIFNSIATAEGAIAEAICHSPGNLHGSDCLVTGFGHCAKTLAAKLAGMGARTTVCARSPLALAEAGAYGYGTLRLRDLKSRLGWFDTIFNTIPAMVLNRESLLYVQKDALIIDLASAPGGVDFEAAKQLEVTALLCLGLPGKYSPQSSAKALADLAVQNARLK